jgi:hypothetical protein
LSAKNPNGKIEMVFRLWGSNSRATEGVNGHVAQNAGVLALIEDAVASRQGVFVAAHDQLHVSGLKQPSDALVISRQVQLGLQGFRARQGAGPVALSIAIDASSGDRSPSEAEPEASAGSGSEAPADHAAEPSHDLITLLRLSKPAQILLTHDLCQQIAGIKGLPLKSFPGRFGVYEYLWTTGDRIDLLQSEPQLTLAALPAAPSPAPGSQPEKNSDQAIAPGMAAKVSDRPERSDEMVQTASAAFQLARAGASRILVFTVLGLAAVGALVALGIHLMHGAGSNSGAAPALIAAPTPATPALPAAPTRPVPAQVQPASTQHELPHAPRGARANAGEKPHASAPVTPASSQETAQPAQTPDEKPSPVASSTANCTLGSDAGRFVSLAEQARGRGDYANAVRIFREVLACDPNNAAAREGLEKATRGQEQRQR